MTIELDQKLEVRYTVLASDSAKALSNDTDDNFPEVFSTSRMIALMELAAARLMKPLLKEGELSVGVGVNVTHMAATPVGADVVVVAIYLGTEGKLHSFDVQLLDDGGVAGQGSHTRAIIDTQRLIDGAVMRQKQQQF